MFIVHYDVFKHICKQRTRIAYFNYYYLTSQYTYIFLLLLEFNLETAEVYIKFEEQIFKYNWVLNCEF
jgi:hypothetical protein